MNVGVMQLARKGAVQFFASGMMGVLTLAQIAFLSRHFDFRELGIVSTQLLVVAIFTGFCDFGWEGFIIQSRGGRRRIALILGSAMPRLITLAVSADLAIAFGLRAFGIADTAWHTLFYVAPVLPLVFGVGALQGFAVRAIDIERLALSEVLSKLIGVAVTIGTAWWFNSVNCVLLGFVSIIVAKFIFLSTFQFNTLKVMIGSFTRRADASKLFHYMSTQVAGQLFNILGGKADELIVASTMSIEIFGIYASIKQLVIQGTSFIAPLIRRMTMPYFSRDRLEDGVRVGNTISIFVWSNAAYIGFFLALAIASGFVTQFVLGQRFVVHVDLLIRFCVLWSFQTFAGATMSAYFQSTGAPYKALGWMSAQVVVQLAVMWATVAYGLEVMLSCAIVSYAALAFGFHLWFFHRQGELDFGQVFRRLLVPAISYYLLAGLIVWGQRLLHIPNIYEIAGAGVFVGSVVLLSLRETRFRLFRTNVPCA